MFMVSVVVSFYGFRRGRKRFLMVSVAERFFFMVSVAASNVFCFFVLSRQVTVLSAASNVFCFIAASNVFLYRGK